MRRVVRDMIVVTVVELLASAVLVAVDEVPTAIVIGLVGPIGLWSFYLVHPGGLRLDLWLRRTGIRWD